MSHLQIVGAAKNVSPQHVELKVPLYSHGCGKKVKKALSHLRGIHSVDVDYYQQKMTVWGICDREDVLCAVRRKRRGARFWDQTEEADEAVAAEEEAEGRVDSEKTAAAAAAAAGGVSRFKSRKAWKKLFPLIMYLM